MRTLPKSQDDLIRFFELHTSVWAGDPAAIGLDGARVAQVAAAAADARAKYAAATSAREAAKAATTALRSAIATLRATGGPAISTIRAFAASAPNPSQVYSAAEIDPPSDPTPAPAPEAARDISITLRTDGALLLRWRARQPAPGAEVYTKLRRRLDGAGPFAELAATGEAHFTDDTVPAGTRQVEYLLTVCRGATESPTEIAAILLGRPQAAGAGAGALPIAA
ncbi:MAG: hypothetical protein ACF8R7_11975 [Phycisphaerales bacterium JB039]